VIPCAAIDSGDTRARDRERSQPPKLRKRNAPEQSRTPRPSALKGREPSARGNGIAAAMRPNETIEPMMIQRMEHVGIVVNDLPAQSSSSASSDYFGQLGLESGGKAKSMASGWSTSWRLTTSRWSSRRCGPQTAPEKFELVKFHSPPTETGTPLAPADTPGLRHLAFLVEDIHTVVADLEARGTDLVGELVRYGDSYWLCYIRGPEGIIVELWPKRSIEARSDATARHAALTDPLRRFNQV
jgi:catechol 2,3-dioxygenase-like lactoylglutathione lyase family enzyme